jgi:hypothetical protein
MEFNKNNIKKVVFEVDYYDSNTAQPLQNNIISEFNVNTSGKIDELFHKYTAGYLFKTNCLELDLGVLSKESCENNLTNLIAKELQSFLIKLNRKIEANDIPSGIEIISLNENLFNYLLNYFSYGRVEWNHEYFSLENDIGYWLNQLGILSPELFYQIAKVFKNKEARIRFFNSIPVYKDETPFYEIFPVEVGKKLSVAEKLLRNILELSGHPKQYKILGDFLLFVLSDIADSKGGIIDAMYVSQNFYNYSLTEKDLKNSDLFAKIIQIDQNLLENDQKIIVEELFKRHSSFVSKSYDISIELPPEVADSYNTWDTFKKILDKRVPNWAKTLIETTHRIVLSIEKKSKISDTKDIERMVRKLAIESVTTTDFPENIDLWKNVFLEQIVHEFGQEFMDGTQEIIITTINENKNIKSVQKTSVLKKISFRDGENQFQVNLDIALRYLRYFSKVGIRGLKKYFREPISVLEQILLAIKTDFPTYYKVELSKVAKSLYVSDIQLIKDSSFDSVLQKELVDMSDFRKVLSKLGNKVEKIEGLLLLEILSGKIIPAYILKEYGFNKLAFLIRNYIKQNKESIEQIIKDLNIDPEKVQFEYLEKITDQQSFKIITELLGISTDVKKELLPEPGIELFIKFQQGIELFYSERMTSQQLADFKIFVIKLIDIRSNEFAKFIIVQTDKEIELIKKILPESHRNKIDTMLLSVRDSLLIHEEEIKKEQIPFVQEGEEIYVRNSGLIILNPYLNTLFTRLGYVENKKFISDIYRNKAIRAMHFLVTGTTNWEEPDIVLNKILAGIEPSEIITNDFDDMTQEEKNICEGLLEAVLKNWGALKNTSIDSLRGSFLIRNGKLWLEQSSWRLTVERKALDVLLDKMPWSFTTIKLPWMTNTLITEW